MNVKRSELCLGYLTGNCIYASKEASCKDLKKEECYPPMCTAIELIPENCNKVFCKVKGEYRDLWKDCLKCKTPRQ